MVSPLWKSGHLPQLINYSPLENGGGGNDEAPGSAGGRRVAPGLLWSLWAEPGAQRSTRIPRVAEVGRGRLSAAAGRSHAGPLRASPCDAGPVAGPHCWAWAEREKEELEKQWPAGPGATGAQRGLGERGAAHGGGSLGWSQRPPCLPRRRWVPVIRV